MSMFAKFMLNVRQILLPSQCLLCGFTIQIHQRLQWGSVLHQQLCRACFEDLPTPSLQAEYLPLPSTYDACFTLFPYQAPLSGLILQLKTGALIHASFFATLFLYAIQTHWYVEKPLPDLLLPMPLHPKRIKERGFNQALEIAKPLSKKLGIPLIKNGIVRHKYTANQRHLKASQRAENMKHAFIHNQSYANLHVAILDDVVTTGHTVTACAQALRMAHARRIDVWCCTRRY